MERQKERLLFFFFPPGWGPSIGGRGCMHQAMKWSSSPLLPFPLFLLTWPRPEEGLFLVPP